MDKRLELHEILVDILGSRNVYFQPPASIRMKYPCIIYELDDIFTINADNTKYKTKKRYKITVVDEDPDSELVDKLHKLQYCSFDRFYTSDNLNHFVFTLYF